MKVHELQLTVTVIIQIILIQFDEQKVNFKIKNIQENKCLCFPYSREFGKHCSACHEPIQADDWVRFARDNVYHVDCFTCNVCDKHLSTGDEFLLKDDLPLCRMHVTTGAGKIPDRSFISNNHFEFQINKIK